MSYALNDWPPAFRSQTCDPASPFFVGRKGSEQNRSNAPSEKAVEILSKVTAGYGKYRTPAQRNMRLEGGER